MRNSRHLPQPAPEAARFANLVAKRALDLLVAVPALVVVSPVLAVVAVLIRRKDGGPAIYASKRVGKDGRPFRMYKFRTMVVDAERIGGPSTAADDPRLTRIGERLRRYKLDEVPQLWNVVRGEMSLVGPRPEVPAYVDLYTPNERRLLSVKPGITDWASIRFRDEGEILRGAADPEQAYMERIRPAKVQLGLEYVRRQSFWIDLAILAATARAVLSPARPGSSQR